MRKKKGKIYTLSADVIMFPRAPVKFDIRNICIAKTKEKKGEKKEN